jgi:hypothetical protein
VGILPAMAVSFVAAFGGPGMTLAAQATLTPQAPAAVEVAPAGRWTDVRLAAELRDKDTATIDVITAGEEQKSTFDQCAAAADVVLCRILVGAVNAAAILGTSIPGN